jgi:uncharacterized protein with von Willebrand factor type A (vWA) domain
MCSWMQGRDFCGRRFNSSEELMAHLRSHTASMAAATSSLEQQQVSATVTTMAPSSGGPSVSSALAMLQAQAQAMRADTSPASSSASSSSSPPALSAGPLDPRYHPYGRYPPHLSPAFLSSLYASPRPILPVLP